MKLSDALKHDLSVALQSKERAEGHASEMEGRLQELTMKAAEVEQKEAARAVEVTKVTAMYKEEVAQREMLQVGRMIMEREMVKERGEGGGDGSR